jgi:hypothetical protein
MKSIPAFFIAVFLIIISCNEKDRKKEAAKPVAAESASVDGAVITKTENGVTDTIKKSIRAYVKNKIGPADFKIAYHSPAVRGRIIWGGLVPFDQVWVTGAHMATSIETDRDFIIDKKKIQAGKYALFTIPGKVEWEIIINKNWNQHLADEYNEKDDVLRWKLKPDTLGYVQERLMYDINQWAQKEGNILMMWEKLKLVIPVRIAD